MANEVDTWFESYDNPMAPVVQAVRKVVLGVDERMGECIKWKSPTFTFNGNLASFNPRAKAHASLMFHVGAKIPGKHPVLEGGGDTARYIRFASLADVKKKRAALVKVVTAWIAWKEEAPKTTKKSTKKKSTKKKSTKNTARR